MSTIIVASANPAKISAVADAFCEAFPGQSFSIEGISVSSEVRDQPLSADETLRGARNRVKNARQIRPEADYYVGLEAGIDDHYTFAWMVIENGNQRGEARSASLPLPALALEKIQQGIELGDVMDEMFNQQNIKQKGGAIAMLTNNILSRSSVYQQALILALIPFMNQTLFPASKN